MQQYLLTSQAGGLVETPMPSKLPQWLRFDVSEINSIDEFIATVQRLSGVTIQALHVQDAINGLHPSHYDGDLSYERFVFRSLLPNSTDSNNNSNTNTNNTNNNNTKKNTEKNTKKNTENRTKIFNTIRKRNRYHLPVIVTQPVAFLIAPQLLISVQHSKKLDLIACFTRLSTTTVQPNIDGSNASIMIRPYQLFLRFINVQVDAYLALRQPLTDQLDQWQRELLDPRRAFNNWASLLDARLELRKLEALSEEQMDAIAELREEWLDDRQRPYSSHEYDNLRVRLADIIEHIARVLNHAKRLESSVESAIQLHFAAVAHQTNRTVRNLTILTGVFAPLSLMTGFYGMNIALPWQNSPQAVWWIMLGMLLSAILVLGSIVVSRFLNHSASTRYISL
jgi:Mg2+ and Co2+ transporter CorA